MNNVGDLFQKLSNTYDKEIVSIVKCEVISVGETIICLPVNSAISCEIEVPLGDDNGNTISFTPSVGSIVNVALTNKNLILLLSIEDADNINISANNGIELNGGEFGGLVKVEELTTKINNLENLLNSLVTKYNTHVHVTNGVPTVTLETTILIETERANIENENITHGN